MICQREGCENNVPDGRARYCSPECAHEANKARSRKRAKQLATERLRTMSPHRKMRTCLGPGCYRRFMSEGPWNRICPQCSGRRIRTPDLDTMPVKVGTFTDMDVDPDTAEVESYVDQIGG